MPDPVTLGSLAPSLVTAAGGIANSLLGGLFGSSANKQNIELQRETNRQNYQMFKEQQAFNVDMWNKQNEYNLPANQVKRLLDAGINPASVFGNGSVSEAGSLTSPSPAPMQSPHVNPYQPDLKVGDAVNAYYQSQLMNAQKQKIKSEYAHQELVNMFESKSMDDRLKSLQYIAKGNNYRAEIARQELSYIQDSYYWRLKSLRNDIVSQEDQHRLTVEQIYNHKLQNGLAEVQLAYAPQLNEAQLKQYYETVNQIKAQIGLINANTMLTKEERLHEIEKKVGTIIQNGMSSIDFNVKNAVKKFVIQDAKNNSAMLDFNRRNQKTLTRFNMFSSVVPFSAGIKF